MNSIRHEDNGMVSHARATGPKRDRILSGKMLGRLAKFNSYIAYFLLGAFLGLSIFGTIDKFIGIPEFLTSTMSLESLSITIGSSIAVLSKILFSLK